MSHVTVTTSGGVTGPDSIVCTAGTGWAGAPDFSQSDLEMVNGRPARRLTMTSVLDTARCFGVRGMYKYGSATFEYQIDKQSTTVFAGFVGRQNDDTYSAIASVTDGDATLSTQLQYFGVISEVGGGNGELFVIQCGGPAGSGVVLTPIDARIVVDQPITVSVSYGPDAGTVVVDGKKFGVDLEDVGDMPIVSPVVQLIDKGSDANPTDCHVYGISAAKRG